MATNGTLRMQLQRLLNFIHTLPMRLATGTVLSIAVAVSSALLSDTSHAEEYDPDRNAELLVCDDLYLSLIHI